MLDGRGRPVRRATPSTAAVCAAAPARAREAPRRGLRCPTTWEAHLRDNGRTVRKRPRAGPLQALRLDPPAHPRCRPDHLPRVRRRHHALGADGMPMDRCRRRAGTIGARPRGRRTAEPPSVAELEHVAPPIQPRSAPTFHPCPRWRSALERLGHHRRARDGNHILVLTNRHVVESDDRARLCALDAMTRRRRDPHELRVARQKGSTSRSSRAASSAPRRSA